MTEKKEALEKEEMLKEGIVENEIVKKEEALKREKARKREKEPVNLKELDRWECLKLRPLWEEVFYEDSREFTEYYFAEKATRNHAFALEKGNRFLSMVHLAPYDMMVRTGESFACVRTSYIVGVATKEQYRHRGFMDCLLKRSLSWLYEKEQPFAFLMPASPEIYRPYQFTYIYDREEYLAARIGREKTGLYAASAADGGFSAAVLREGEIPQLVDYVNQRLRSRMDVFVRRDEAYYRTMQKELLAQNGELFLLQKESGEGGRDRTKEIAGYYLYTQEEKPEILEAVWDGGREIFQIKEKRKPVIMARIVHLERMLSLLRTKEGEADFSVKVSDPLLPENNGVFLCRVTACSAGISRREEPEVLDGRADQEEAKQPEGLKQPEASEKQEGPEKPAECFVTVDQLTAWLFGYRKTEECFSPCSDEAKESGTDGTDWKKTLCKLNRIRTLRQVFINEIV